MFVGSNTVADGETITVSSVPVLRVWFTPLLDKLLLKRPERDVKISSTSRDFVFGIV